MTFTFSQTKAGYAHMWDEARIASPHVNAAVLARATAQRALNLKPTFMDVQAAADVPWWWVACTLYREADLNPGCYLGNGQSLKRVTTVVPRGRGPFSSFQAGALDALKLDGLYKISQPWTVEFALWAWEKFNGQGYFHLNVNSPYVWNWTNLYSGGKYVADGQFSRTVYDVQGGCAAVLKELMQLDPTVNPAREGASSPTLKEIPPMISTLPTLPSGAAFPASLSTIVSIATGAAEFLPGSIKPLVLIPLDLMKIPGEIQSGPPDATHIAGIVIKHLRAVADDLAAAFPQPPAT
jgi:lysozyme family protein